ncbi:MAG TPA: helix-turn-helix transcriptional regulator [Streptosporangiaceae bacterium]|nr:helix-turn-helix transcriptional regulator [Streptosporangiaceae bacterium]
MPVSPSLRRRRLAAELRQLREQSGQSISDVAGKLGWQGSRISRIETRQLGVTAADLRKLLDAYGVDDEGYRAMLAEMGRRANERGWWQSYPRNVVPSEYGDLITVEAEAATIRSYQPEAVPGLLQTAGYAGAVIRAGRKSDTAAEIDRRVEVRLERQHVLTRTDPPPPRVQVVLNEAVLRRRVGGPDVMREQLEYLMAERDPANVTIQVLPFDSGAHPSMVGPFTMITFLDPGDLGVVYLEHPTGSLFLETPEELRAYEEFWDEIQGSAYSPDDTRTFLKTYSLRYG